MYNTDKNINDIDKLEIEKALEGLDTATACALFPILENQTPVEESETGVSQTNVSADVAYERLLRERKDLEILTPKETYLKITQRIHYRCKKCGNEYRQRKDRLLTKQAGIGKPFACKGCSALEGKYITQAFVLQRTHYYVHERGGKIVNLIKPKYPYVTISDKLHIRCREGHEWITTHRFLHTGAWCVRCSGLHGIDTTIPMLPNIKKGLSKELEFYVWRQAAGHFSMEVMFEMPGKPQREYFCQCQVCKRIARLTPKQLSQRNYLCLNRCVPSNMPSLTEAIVASGYFIGHPEEKHAVIIKEYAESIIKYNEWKKKLALRRNK
jgi:predicted SprT family Zn-dependent metalloprotease